MRKSLKSKITSVYLGLILTIAFMGIFSYLNLSRIRTSIDGFLIDNYRSINASNNMLEVVEKENTFIVNYINKGDEDSIEAFYDESSEFYKWFNIEWNNITEKDERDYVAKIKKCYVILLRDFSNIQEVRNTKGIEQSIKYYNTNVIPSYSNLTKELRGLSILNEDSMFRNKNNITVDTKKTMNLILVLSVSLATVCFFLCTFFVNKFLRPIYLLTETMKLVKEGDLDKQAPIVSEDEIGNLAKEFNNMTKRLQLFEQSTLGKLLNEKNKSLAIVKSISEPLVVLDRNYKVILINDKCEDFFDIQERQVIGRHFLEAVRNGDVYDFIHRIYDEEQEENQGIFAIKKYDMENYFNVTVNIIRDSSSRLEGVVVFFQNITELKSLEKVRADFVSSISHEFKTPLTSLTFGASLLKSEKIGQLNDKQIEILDTIQEEACKLSKLVSDLLRLSKIECEKPIFEMDMCNIEDIIKDSVEEFLGQAEEKNINLHYEVEGKIKDVKGDFEKLNWVFNNLISNALKFTTSRGEIFIKAWMEDKRIYVSVKDTGVGISDQYLDKIFEKFVQIDREEDEDKGTGLGLAISKQIVEVHGGQIWCESEMGKGSIFTFYIPVD